VDWKAGSCRKRKSSGSSAKMALTSARSKTVNYFKILIIFIGIHSLKICIQINI